jgi:hypothetical protein
MTEVLKKLLNALQKGPVRAIGLSVYDIDSTYLYQTTDLKDAIDELHKRKDSVLRVGRVDAGGSPTWDLQ